MEAHVPAAAVVGVVAREAVQLGADGGFEDVPRAAREEVQARAVGTEAHDAAGAELKFPPVRAFGFHETEVADGGVNPAVHA